MNKENTLDIIRKAFGHFIIEENIQLDGLPVYMYIPTLQTILISEEAHTNSYLEVVIKDEQNDVGKIINDILLDCNFIPMLDTE